MRAPIIADLNLEQPTVNAGRINEHNSQELLITPPTEINTADYYRVVFDNGSKPIYSEMFEVAPFALSLWQDLTKVSPLVYWVEGYAGDGTYLGKSRAGRLVFSGPQESGEPGGASGVAQGMQVEVSANTAARHTHANKVTLNKLTEDANGVPLFDGEPIGSVPTVAKFSDLPAAGTLALVENDETVPQEPFDFADGQEYALMLNPYPPLNKEFNVSMTLSEESEYAEDTINISCELAQMTSPALILSAIRAEDSVRCLWIYTENGTTNPDGNDIPPLILPKNWSYIEVLSGDVQINESIKYTDLPELKGIFAAGVSAVIGLGGHYLTEGIYNVNKLGVYYFDPLHGNWARGDNDYALWCEATGFLSKAFGYGNATPGDASFAGGGYGNATPGDLSFAGGGSGNATPGDASFAGGGYGNSAPGDGSFAGGGSGNSAPGDGSFAGGGSGNSAPGDGSFAGGGYGNATPGDASFAGGGQGLIASAPNSAIFGRYGETTPYTLFCVANGAELGRNSLAFNVDADMAEFFVPVVAPQHIEYYSQEVEQLRTDIVNTYIMFDDVTFVLPPAPTLGIAGKFELWIRTNGTFPVYFSDFVAWENGTPYNFMRAGTHKITGFYNNLYGMKWFLDGKLYDFPPL